MNVYYDPKTDNLLIITKRKKYCLASIEGNYVTLMRPEELKKYVKLGKFLPEETYE